MLCSWGNTTEIYALPQVYSVKAAQWARLPSNLSTVKPASEWSSSTAIAKARYFLFYFGILHQSGSAKYEYNTRNSWLSIPHLGVVRRWSGLYFSFGIHRRFHDLVSCLSGTHGPKCLPVHPHSADRNVKLKWINCSLPDLYSVCPCQVCVTCLKHVHIPTGYRMSHSFL